MAIESRARGLTVPDLHDISSRDGLRAFVTALQRYLKQYVQNQDEFNQKISGALSPLNWEAPIAAAATIAPLAPLQPISGSAAISQIDAGPGSVRFVLLAEDGFTLATGGNVAHAATINAGAAVALYLNFTDNLWYPQL